MVVVVSNNAEAEDMPKTWKNSPHSFYFILAVHKIFWGVQYCIFSCANNSSEAENAHGSKLFDLILNLLKHNVCFYWNRMHSRYWKCICTACSVAGLSSAIQGNTFFRINLDVDVSSVCLWKLPFYFALFSFGKCSLQRIQQVLNEAFRAVHKHEWIKPHNCSVQYRRHPHLILKGSHLWKAAAV